MPENIRKTSRMRDMKKIVEGEVYSSLSSQRAAGANIRVAFILCLVNTELQVNINVHHSEKSSLLQRVMWQRSLVPDYLRKGDDIVCFQKEKRLI